MRQGNHSLYLTTQLMPRTPQTFSKYLGNETITAFVSLLLLLYLPHRKMVDKEKSKQSSRILELNCCAQCLNSISRVRGLYFSQQNGHATKIKTGRLQSGMKSIQGEEESNFRAVLLKTIEIGSV